MWFNGPLLQMVKSWQQFLVPSFMTNFLQTLLIKMCFNQNNFKWAWKKKKGSHDTIWKKMNQNYEKNEFDLHENKFFIFILI